MRYSFMLTGRTALLMHADDVEWSDQLNGWRKDKDNQNLSKAGDDRSPAWTWLGYLYHDGVNVALPSNMMMTCLRGAGAKHILKKQTTMKAITQTGMWIETEYCEFKTDGRNIEKAKVDGLLENTKFTDHTKAALSLGFKLDVRRAKIGQAKHVRVRPRFDSWAVNGVINVTEPEVLTGDVVKSLFETAGKIGLGDWRPGCKTPGPYGQFTAKVMLTK